MKILITGNGTFLEHQKYLCEESIQKRFDNHFEIYFNAVFGRKINGYNILKETLSRHNIITFGDEFAKVIDNFFQDFTSQIWLKNYEQKIGDTIKLLLKYVESKKEIYGEEKVLSFTRDVYMMMLNVIQAVIFEESPYNQEEIKVFQPSDNYDEHYTFNIWTINNLKNSHKIKYLHGQIYPKKALSQKEIDAELIKAAGRPNEDELALVIENVFSLDYLNALMTNLKPVLFGDGVRQKNEIQRAISGWKETNNSRILAAYKRSFSYFELKENSRDLQIDIIGVRAKTHSELLDYICDAKEINWYCFDDRDREEVEELKQLYPKIKISEYE